jgi:hypothetical protein
LSSAFSMAPKRKRNNNIGTLPAVLGGGGEEARLGSPSDEVATSDVETAYEPSNEEEEGGEEFVPGGKRGKVQKAAHKKKKKTGPAEKKKPNTEEENVLRIRPPAFNSDYVPVPFKGRLGYVYT